MENEDYDASENGSLIICNVAVWHEKTYTVIMYTNPIFFEELTVSVKVIGKFHVSKVTASECIGSVLQYICLSGESKDTNTCVAILLILFGLRDQILTHGNFFGSP